MKHVVIVFLLLSLLACDNRSYDEVAYDCKQEASWIGGDHLTRAERLERRSLERACLRASKAWQEAEKEAEILGSCMSKHKGLSHDLKLLLCKKK